MTFLRITPIAIATSALLAHELFAQGFSPEVAEQKMTAAEGLQVSLFAHEPDVRQAILVKCDDRGRLWTIQYLQYPNPAGLERVKIDRWSRTIYDRVPKPPPHGPRGADRITICEDVDGDGRADTFRDFVDGLNLATGVAFGHGGVFVLNVPYLLFYPDRDRDDVPDSDPEVLLTGFGMEDAQSMSNHLTWGPDGWLYGVNGSTTTCRIRDTEFQSGVWRYHPVTHKFELFCEGGYNCYGLTFDQNGELMVSTNGGPFLHAMQGAYYYKSFGKHGPLHNLYAYYHFPLLECDQVPGGPPTGGTAYLENAFPDKYRGKFIAGNFLGHTCSWWNVHRIGSTFRATFGDTLLDSHDTWFGPTDMCVGPDGAMYVSDFHDQRTAHPDPDAKWDLTNGRIYKISANNADSLPMADVRERTTAELVALLRGDNYWLARRALVELAHRRDASAIARLLEMAKQADDEQLALRGLWGLNAVGGFETSVARTLLKHPYPYVRYWTVRLLGDQRSLDDETAATLAALAVRETSAPVAAQLACSAKRLPAQQALPILDNLLETGFAETDDRVPWLIWWGLESKADEARQQMASMFARAKTWTHSARRQNALRLVRRWSAQGDRAGYRAVHQLLQSAGRGDRQEVHEALRLGLSERAVGLHGIGQGGLFGQQAAEDDAPRVDARQFEPLTDELRRYLREIWMSDPNNVTVLELAIRGGVEQAYPQLLNELENGDPTSARTLDLLNILREVGDQRAAAVVLRRIGGATAEPVLLAALDVIDAHGTTSTATSLLHRYAELSPAAQSRLRDVLFSRVEAARALLERVDSQAISSEDIPISQVAQLAAHDDKQIDALVRKHWGQVGPGSSEEILATMRRLNNDLRVGGGDQQRGKALFNKHCGTCHRLHGEGNAIGPDLTTANRNDRAALLENLVNPSGVIRREYAAYVVLTDSGRAVTGMLAEENAAAVTILDAQNRRIKIPRDEIEEIFPSEVSLMPERLLDQLTPEELRDLFAYLEN